MLRSLVAGTGAVRAAVRRGGHSASMDAAVSMSEALGTRVVADPALRATFLRKADPETSAVAQRLSPAARLGSSKVQGDAIVALPADLMLRIETLLAASNKAQLRRDASHVATLSRTSDASSLEPGRAQQFVHSLASARAGPLYVSTQFSARYAVLVRVLDEVRRRIPSAHAHPGVPAKLYDFCMHAGEALWAYAHVFGASSLREYVAEAPTGALIKTGAALQNDACWQHTRTSLRVRGDDAHIVRDLPGSDNDAPSLGVHAFGLGALHSDLAREKEVLRLWKSGADVLVLIEEATPRGFACIAAARAQLLALGHHGPPCHVVAPCPHDGACPVWHLDALLNPQVRRPVEVCAHSQMYRVPPFMRATTRLQRGDATTEFCYVIVRRTERPSLPDTLHAWATLVPPELQAHVPATVQHLATNARQGDLDALRATRAIDPPPPMPAEIERCAEALAAAGIDEHRVMQVDAYAWPRLVRPPLKKGGHVTLDACCATSDVRRFTVAKSAGRQAYQDARKVRHGELYAHMDSAGRSVPLTERPEHDTPTYGAHAATEHKQLGPDAQSYSRQHGRLPKRRSTRAPKLKAATILDASRSDVRSSRKPSRSALDQALQEHGW
ncbi:37S ribosomal protein S22 [Malassezia equina]|uniref:37S ribosomal protein S22 n=1 Tax=Malassezia equina TaxID=1381935 RepID=A0AAF0EC44_9BASI|nr:37S ribosomal protein S22 [Malassezia equina]